MNAACVFVAYIKSTATITTPQVQVGRQQQQQQRKGNPKLFRDMLSISTDLVGLYV